VSKRLTIVLALAIALSGCGSDEEPPGPPQLPPPVAQELAAASDAVAIAFEAGDACGARAAAEDLRSEAIAAINARRVPAVYHEELSAAVNDLVDRIECVPPDEPDDEEEENRGPGNGKGNGQGKGKGKGKSGGDD
jgi:hypothetical protein